MNRVLWITVSLLLAVPAGLRAALPTEFDPTGRDWALSQADDFAKSGITSTGGLEVAALWEVTTGSNEVLVALPLAPDWSDPQLRLRWWLNRGELGGKRAPANDRGTATCRTWITSSTDPWDINNDGAFNVEDYACDSRIDPAASGTTEVDPGDLLASVLVDGIDQDGSGVADDLAGWFDPTVPAPASRSSDKGRAWWRIVAAEADGKEDVGVCPRCRIVPVVLPERLGLAEAERVAAWLRFANVTVFGEWLPDRWAIASHSSPFWRSLIANLTFVWLNGGDTFLPDPEIAIPVLPGRPNKSPPQLATRFDLPAACRAVPEATVIRIPSLDCGPETVARAAGLAGLLQSVYRQTVGKIPGSAVVGQYFRLQHGDRPSGERMAARAMDAWRLPTLLWASPKSEAWWSSRRNRQSTVAINVAASTDFYNYDLLLQASGQTDPLEVRLRTQGDHNIRVPVIPDLFERSLTLDTHPDSVTLALSLGDGKLDQRFARVQWRLPDRRLASGFPVDSQAPVLQLWGDKNGLWVVLLDGSHYYLDLSGKKGMLLPSPVGIPLAVAGWRAMRRAYEPVVEAAWLVTDHTVYIAGWPTGDGTILSSPTLRAETLSVSHGPTDEKLVVLSGPSGVAVIDARDGSVPTPYAGLATVDNNGQWWSPPAVGDVDGDGWPDLLFWNTGYDAMFGTGKGTQLILYLTDTGTLVTSPLLTGLTASEFGGFPEGQRQLPQPTMTSGGRFAALIVPGITVSGSFNKTFTFSPGSSWQQPAWDEKGNVLTLNGTCQITGIFPCDIGVSAQFPRAGAPIVPMAGRKGRNLFALQEATGWRFFEVGKGEYDTLATGRASAVFDWFDAQADGLLDLAVASLHGDVALYRTTLVGTNTTVESSGQGPENDGWLAPDRFTTPKPDAGFGCTVAPGSTPVEFVLWLIVLVGLRKRFKQTDH